MSADSAFLIERVPLPEWLDEFEATEVQNLFGEQVEWGFSIPWMSQVLASPRSLRPMLQAPAPGDHLGSGGAGILELTAAPARLRLRLVTARSRLAMVVRGRQAGR